MSEHVEVLRLYLGSFDAWGRTAQPFHGYVVKHPQGVVLVDSGMPASPEHWPARARDAAIVSRAVDDALADHGLCVADVRCVINTHLDIDHCGQNIVFEHLPFFVQQRELERAKRLNPDVPAYFDWMRVRWELLDGDAEILPGVHALFTPGHTEGHQSVLIDSDLKELIVGDAAYTADLWEDPDNLREGHPLWKATIDNEHGQIRTDRATWRASLDRLHRLEAGATHLCHSPTIFRNPPPPSRDH